MREGSLEAPSRHPIAWRDEAYYDRTDLDGFYVAIGTSGNQYKNAGVAGQLMADLIEAVENGHDHDSDPVVSIGRYTGTEMNIGFFSRNREINLNSSMSVHG